MAWDSVQHTCDELKNAMLKVILNDIHRYWELTDPKGNVGLWPISYCPCCGTKLPEEV